MPTYDERSETQSMLRAQPIRAGVRHCRHVRSGNPAETIFLSHVEIGICIGVPHDVVWVAVIDRLTREHDAFATDRAVGIDRKASSDALKIRWKRRRGFGREIEDAGLP